MSMINLLRKAVMAGMLFIIPAASHAQISFGISLNINLAPPEIPVYVQPPCPEPNLIWTPGYWSWDPDSYGYFWVPGTWVAAPQPGYLWTPGYWGWNNGVYVFNSGYWGTQVGFYGGVNYGFGYGGAGFIGGEWRGGTFAYNTAVVNVNTTVIHNTYINKTVINNTTIINNHTSFNGGPNGVQAKPTPQETAFARQPHLQATAAQTKMHQIAKQDPSNFASANHGVPAHAATPRPVSSAAELQHSAVPAKLAPGAHPYTAPKTAANGKPAQKPGAPEKNAPEKNAMKSQPEAKPMEKSKPAPMAKPMEKNMAPEKTAPKPKPEPKPEARPEAKAEAKPMEKSKPAPAAKPAQHPAEHPKEQKPEDRKPD